MTTKTPPLRARLALAMILLALILLGGFGKPTATEAGWQSRLSADSNFQTTNVGSIEPSCDASADLLNLSMTVAWDEPELPAGQTVKYQVAWEGTGLLTGRNGYKETTDREFSRYVLLGGLLGTYSMTISVTPVLVDSGWRGTTSTETARGESLLGILGSSFDCDV